MAGNLVGKFLLEDVLSSKDAPLQEMASADLVALEAPPVTKQGFEQRMLEAVLKLRAASLEILLVVLPSLRKKSNKSTWVYRWNRLRNTPFKFSRPALAK